MVHVVGREQAEAAVMMFGVVPREEALAVDAGASRDTRPRRAGWRKPRRGPGPRSGARAAARARFAARRRSGRAARDAAAGARFGAAAYGSMSRPAAPAPPMCAPRPAAVRSGRPALSRGLAA